MRSGWKGSSASSFSPVPMKRIGLPLTARTDSAAPPRASPSSLVSATPSKSTASAKALATSTAVWPVMASTTSTTLVGCTAALMRTSSSIISASMVRRPAVSTITRSRPGLAGRLDAVARDGDRVAALLAVHRDVDLLAQHGQLLGGRRAVDVAGHEHRGAPLGAEVPRQLGAAGGLAGALQAGHQHDRGRLGRERQGDVGLAHQRRQLLADDLHDLLVRGQRVHHLGALGARGDGGRELLDHGQADVRLEQRQADRAHRRSMSESVSLPRPLRPEKTPCSLSVSASNIGDRSL